MGKNGYGIDMTVLTRIAADIAEVADLGIKLCLVVGGGNIYRGLAGASGRHGPGERRLYGHACNGLERTSAGARA